MHRSTKTSSDRRKSWAPVSFGARSKGATEGLPDYVNNIRQSQYPKKFDGISHTLVVM